MSEPALELVMERPNPWPVTPADLPGIVPANKGWMSDVEIATMVGFATMTRGHVPGRLLEVGAHQGRTTSGLVQAYETIVVVDTFLGGHDLPLEDVYFSFETNMRRWWSMLEIRRGDSREVLPQLLRENARFRLALVDGCHEADVAAADLCNAWELLSNGGYLFIDDYDWPSVQSAIDVLAEYAATHGAIWRRPVVAHPVSNKLCYVRKVDGRLA